MSKSTFYVGIDVGQEELWAAVESKKARMFLNSKSGIKQMANWVKKYSDGRQLHFCMEATGVYGYALATSLSVYPNTEISIVNPAQIASYAKAQLRRTKTDRVDAQVIRDFARSQNPNIWKPERESLRKLYHLVNMADTLSEDIRRWNNRCHSSKYINDLPKEISKSQKAVIKNLTNQLNKIEQSIQQLCEHDKQLKQQVELLSSIPGIAEHSATRLLAYGRSSLTTHSKKELTAHAGLAPSHKQSGISVRGKSSISKMGNKKLRSTLFMPALVAIVHNPNIKKHYQNLLDKGKPKKLAVVACMRKLLIMAQAILLKKTPFKPILPLT